jgi:hypothetical protein
MLKGQVCPDFFISAIRLSSDRVTHNPLTGWSPEMDHRKSERVPYRNGIRKAVSFSLL